MEENSQVLAFKKASNILKFIRNHFLHKPVQMAIGDSGEDENGGAVEPSLDSVTLQGVLRSAELSAPPEFSGVATFLGEGFISFQVDNQEVKLDLCGLQLEGDRTSGACVIKNLLLAAKLSHP